MGIAGRRAMASVVERLVRQRARFIKDYDNQARLDLGKLFRIEDYPSKDAIQGKFSIRYRITPVPDADHFIAKLASDDTDRVKHDIERHIEEQLHAAVGDLYRRSAEAVERVSARLQEDENGKPLVFRDTMISNIRDLVDVVPRLNIFGGDTLARLCEQVKDPLFAPLGRGDRCAPHRDRDGMRGDGVRAQAPYPPGRARSGTLADGLAARHPRAAGRCRLHAPARRRSSPSHTDR